MPPQRDKVIANAEKLVAKGKVENAIREYERLLEDFPNDVNTLNRVGDLWVRINRTDEAVKVFTRIADHYSKDGFFLKAIAIYKKINKLDPSKLDIYGKLADLYARQGLAMEAKSQYQVLADFYLRNGDVPSALGTYRKISELDPNSINVHVKLADLYSQNSQPAEALKEYDRLGRILLKRGMLEEAGQVLRKALKIDPSNVALIESLVTTMIESRDLENAVRTLQSGLESSRDNPRLLALLGKAYAARGDIASAEAALERGVTSHPHDPAIREELADLYLRQGATDRALSVVAPVVERAVERRDRTAIELLNRILREQPAHVPTLHKLVDVYTRLGEESNILASMNSLVEAQIARQDFSAAAGVLQELVRREPENAQHRDKLAFVRQKSGLDTRAAASPQPQQQPPPAAAPAPPPAPAPQPAAAPPVAPPKVRPEEFVLDGPELSLDRGHGAPDVEVDFELEPPAPPPPAAPSPPSPPSRTATSLPAAVDLIAASEGDDIDFITEHMTEAEVFAKYGLSEKAIEHLEAIIARAPEHVPAWDKLLHVCMDEGDAGAVARVAAGYLRVLEGSRDLEGADALRQVLIERGYSAQSPAAQAPAPAAPPRSVRLEPPSAVLSVEPLPEEEFTLEFDSDMAAEVDEVEFDIEGFEADEVPIAESVPEPLAEEEIPPVGEQEFPAREEPRTAAEAFTLDESLLDAGVDESIEEISFEDEPEISFGDEEPVEFDDISAPAGDEAPISFEAEEPRFDEEIRQTESVVAAEPAVEELGEIDFYMEQELFDEATEKLETLLARFPEHPELVHRSRQLSVAHEERAGGLVSPSSLSADDIESELLSALPLDEELDGESAPAAGASAPAPLDEESLFADEDDFFDLAAELEQELEEESEPAESMSEEEQSLEEIFREFKKGVEQQLDSEDYDTHYNLGIAYKEMGLIDEAIGEFQLASKDPKRTIECCSMLGLCFLEKGMPQLAVKWYTKGLEVPEITDDEHLGLMYDLGLAYLEVGDTTSAHKVFLEIYGSNSNYRDIASRIKQLEDARS
jgi:pilus assembly protein FimV